MDFESQRTVLSHFVQHSIKRAEVESKLLKGHRLRRLCCLTELIIISGLLIIQCRYQNNICDKRYDCVSSKTNGVMRCLDMLSVRVWCGVMRARARARVCVCVIETEKASVCVCVCV